MADKYIFTDDMGEISGFGGGYEKECRDMVVRGLEWLDEHPEADLKFSEYKNIYGIINEETEDAKALVKAMLGGETGHTGAMVQATVGHVMWIRKNGWDTYVEKKKQHQLDETRSTTESTQPQKTTGDPDPLNI